MDMKEEKRGDSIKVTRSLFQEREGGAIPTSPLQYRVGRIEKLVAYRYFRERHYSKSCSPNVFPAYGLFDGFEMIGALAFHIPTSENLREGILGKEHKRSVLELHRLFIEDCTPKNTESWFIGLCLRLLKKEVPSIRAVVAFSDPTEGHVGTVYKATNFRAMGQGSPARFYRDKEGRLRYPRQAVWVNGVRVRKNLTIEEARDRGWSVEKRQGKIKFVYLYS